MILKGWCRPSSPPMTCDERSLTRTCGDRILRNLVYTARNLLEFFARECSHCLRTHTALSYSAKNETSGGLIIGGFSYDDVIILSHNQVEPNQSAASLSCGGVKRLQTFRAFLTSLIPCSVRLTRLI